MMRMDPQLTFLKICGPPDDDEMIATKPMNKDFELEGDNNSKLDCDDDDSIMSGSKTPSERASSVKPSDKMDENSKDGSGDKTSTSNGQYRSFPSGSELNGRLRRLIASYQRETKKEESRIAAQDRRNERRERIEQVIREREQQKNGGKYLVAEEKQKRRERRKVFGEGKYLVCGNEKWVKN